MRAKHLRWLVAAAVLGGLHALVSFYWGLGGQWLLPTLGTRLVERFAGLEWVLVLVALVKAAIAISPVVIDRQGWPARRWTRTASWAVAVTLALWGGANTVVGNLVLAGIIRPGAGYDRPGMIGHAWLWDPLFLAWGLALATGMYISRPSARTSIGSASK